MRILCCLNRDLVSNVALNLLLPALGTHEVRIGLTERVGGTRSQADDAPARRELRAAEQTLPVEVLFPLIERGRFADDGARFLTFVEVERHRGIAVAPLPDPNMPEALADVRRFAPDLILSIRYGAILKTAVIAIPRLGVLNLHAGLLPTYRGVLASFRALMHGDEEIGSTLHYISDATIDTGDIVGMARVPVVRGRSLLGHVLALYPGGIALVTSALARLEEGEGVLRRTQPTAGGAYYSYPSAAEWLEFERRGWRVASMQDMLDTMGRYLPAGRPTSSPS
jgi:methionyl-tRNA formyltransferase